jgi:DNA end-binding protein Ku
MRSIWSGAISFGLVNIPVKLYSAVGENTIDFDMLRASDHSPIRYARIATVDGEEVPFKEIVKGYEYEKNEYVVLSDEDFEKASPEKTKAIDILDFVNEEEIDTIYFEKPYYLEPDKGAGKSYKLLLEALKDSKKVGIAQYVLRNRERLGAVRAFDDLIILEQLRFHQEIRDWKEINIPKNIKIGEKEMDMAKQLIEQLSTSFKPDKYKDTYINELMKIMEAKVKGEEIEVKKPKQQPQEVTDLMSVLKQSLKAVKDNKKAAELYINVSQNIQRKKKF